MALEFNADRLLIDERRDYIAAKARGLFPIGILGLLYEASTKDIVNLVASINRLTTETNFRCDLKIISEVLRRQTSGKK